MFSLFNLGLTVSRVTFTLSSVLELVTQYININYHCPHLVNVEQIVRCDSTPGVSSLLVVIQPVLKHTLLSPHLLRPPLLPLTKQSSHDTGHWSLVLRCLITLSGATLTTILFDKLWDDLLCDVSWTDHDWLQCLIHCPEQRWPRYWQVLILLVLLVTHNYTWWHQVIATRDSSDLTPVVTTLQHRVNVRW